MTSFAQDIEAITVENAEYYPNLMDTIRELFPLLNDNEQRLVAGLVMQTCSGCFDNADGCWCQWDE